jgi:hypothetical protein
MDLSVTAAAVVICSRLVTLAALALRLRSRTRRHRHRWEALAQLVSQLPPGALLEVDSTPGEDGRVRFRSPLDHDKQERHARV